MIFFVVIVPFHLEKNQNENRLLQESSFRRHIQQADFSQEVSVLCCLSNRTQPLLLHSAAACQAGLKAFLVGAGTKQLTFDKPVSWVEVIHGSRSMENVLHIHPAELLVMRATI